MFRIAVLNMCFQTLHGIHCRIFSVEALGGGRKFIATAYAEFWRRYSAMPPALRHHYEIVREGSPCHLYFGALQHDRLLDAGLLVDGRCSRRRRWSLAPQPAFRECCSLGISQRACEPHSCMQWLCLGASPRRDAFTCCRGLQAYERVHTSGGQPCVLLYRSGISNRREPASGRERRRHGRHGRRACDRAAAAGSPAGTADGLGD